MSDDDEYEASSPLGSALTFSMRLISAITILSCIPIIAIYNFKEEIRKKNINRVIYYMAACQVGSAVGTMIGQARNGSVECYVQAILTSMFPYAFNFWATTTSYMLYRTIHQKTHVDIFSKRIQGLCWGIPVVLTFLPLITTDFGAEGTDRGWCFLKSRTGSPDWQLTFWVGFSYVLLGFAVLCSVLLISLSIHRANRLYATIKDRSSVKKISGALYRFIWYSIISGCCFIPEAVYDLNESLSHSRENISIDRNVYTYIIFLVSISEGFWVSLAYFTTSKDAQDIIWNFLRPGCLWVKQLDEKTPSRSCFSADPEDCTSQLSSTLFNSNSHMTVEVPLHYPKTCHISSSPSYHSNHESSIETC